MYPNLNAEMARKNIVNADLQKLFGLTERTIRNRLAGTAPFTWPEVIKMRDTFFPEHSVEFLMAKDDKKAG